MEEYDEIYEDDDIPFEFNGVEDFYDFLIIHDVLDNYMANTIDYYIMKGIKVVPTLSLLDKPNLVSMFTWSNTDDGHEFWHDIQNKWHTKIGYQGFDAKSSRYLRRYHGNHDLDDL